MKIKTIWSLVPASFDEMVNNYLAEGWVLSKREVIPTTPVADSVFYAEMVMLDAPDPEEIPAPPADIFEALRVIRDTCEAEASCGNCPMYDWCCRLQKRHDPCDWVLPGEVLE